MVILRTFREAVQDSEFTITAELTIKREFGKADVLAQAESLRTSVDAIQVTDNPYAWVQMSAVAAAGLLIDMGIDPVAIMSCRDRNRIALQSDLLGLRAMGASSVLLMRGHQVPKDHILPARTVFDISARKLIAMARDLDEDETVGPGEAFFIGTNARVFKPSHDWRAKSLTARARAGAQFLQTQLCFNMDTLRAYMERLVNLKVTWNYSMMISLAALPSAKTARWLKDNLGFSLIPEAVIKRLEHSTDPEREGIRICAELLREVADIPGVSGAHLMTMGNPEAISTVIKASGLKRG